MAAGVRQSPVRVADLVGRDAQDHRLLLAAGCIIGPGAGLDQLGKRLGNRFVAYRQGRPDADAPPSPRCHQLRNASPLREIWPGQGALLAARRRYGSPAARPRHRGLPSMHKPRARLSARNRPANGKCGAAAGEHGAQHGPSCRNAMAKASAPRCAHQSGISFPMLPDCRQAFQPPHTQLVSGTLVPARCQLGSLTLLAPRIPCCADVSAAGLMSFREDR